ncbi:MAG: Peptidoglycan-binding lysin domain [Humibacillus sp.]|nr:Peptidoglycan-binding lysin domain [Humibacillus sp.]
MSAIAHSVPILDRPDLGAGDRRAHLRLVPGGLDSGLARSGDSGSHGVEPVRLTRAGRLLVTLVVASTAALLGVGLAGQLASAGSAPRPVTVSAGDTLSQLAARELPALPIREGVIEIQLANQLSTDRITAGQTLLIPTP